MAGSGYRVINSTCRFSSKRSLTVRKFGSMMSSLSLTYKARDTKAMASIHSPIVNKTRGGLLTQQCLRFSNGEQHPPLPFIVCDK